MSAPSMSVSDAAGAFALREIVALERDPYFGLEPKRFACPECGAACSVWVEVVSGEGRHEGAFQVETVLQVRQCEIGKCMHTDQDIRDYAVRLLSEMCDYCKRLAVNCGCP